MSKQDYLNDMNGWDWEGFKIDQVQAAIDTISDNSVEELSLFEMVDNDGAIKGAAFLGTVFNLTPSGKYYQPFACSNVEPCETCAGSGIIDNPDANEELCTLFERKARMLSGYLLDDYGAWGSGLWPKDKENELAEYRGYMVRYSPTLTCPECEGLGSAEAYQDQLWQEALDESADSHDMWAESGEGDPCDIFLARWVSREEIVRYLLDGYRDVVNAWLDRKGGSIKDIKAIDPETKSILNKLDRLD